MKKIDNWEGKLEGTAIEYETEQSAQENFTASTVRIRESITTYDFEKLDKVDYLVAASCGVLTGLLDVFWVGEFSLSKAQTWGREKSNRFVVWIAKKRGYKKDGLSGAIKYLEKDAPIPSDQLTAAWGGGRQHHFRDFAHHASIVGLVFSLLTQFTEMSYGTETDGSFAVKEIPNKDLIGESFEEKVYNGIIIWFFHLVSDMAGSRNNPGKGTGIPGPLLSLAKELSAILNFREIKVKYKDDRINLSVMLSKIFNGTAFKHTDYKDLTRFDLRTEIGVFAFGVKQSIPVIVNQCVLRAFFFVKRLCLEIREKKVGSICDISKLEPKRFLPTNNSCIVRMTTIASGMFCVVDTTDALIHAFLSKDENAGKNIAQFLLRINFIGIGHFILSVKKDIKQSLSGAASPSEIIQQNEAEESDASSAECIDFDLSVDIDNTTIYAFWFRLMLKNVKETKDHFGESLSVYTKMQNPLISMTDYETDLYSKISECCRHNLKVNTEELIIRLFNIYQIDYIPSTDDDIYKEYMPFLLEEKGRRIGYVLCDSMLQPIRGWEIIKEKYKLDGIKALAMVEVGEDLETLSVIMKHEERNTKGFVQYVPLKELFSMISDDEYEIYKSYVNQFNEEVRKLIGYKTIVVPSVSAVQMLKQEIENDLQKCDFDSRLIHVGIYDHQIQILRDNYWGRELYRAIIGKASFADSFVSSEWYYRTHMTYSTLEHTAVIAGYLKSVEQLLYTLVQFSEGTGKRMRKTHGGKNDFIEFNVENEEQIDMTLSSLISFVRHYSDIWDVNIHVKYYIADILDEYRRKYRNDHFHKDNINSIEEIKEIREKTILIHYLLLGAMKIKESDKEKLGIVPRSESSEKHYPSYPELEEWIDGIIGGGCLLTNQDSVIMFESKPYDRNKWRLQIESGKSISEKGLLEKKQWISIQDDLIWDAVQDTDEMEKRVVSLLKEYLEKGRYANHLKSYKIVAAGRFGHPIILYKNMGVEPVDMKPYKNGMLRQS